jgi:UDP-glucose 4-epimerase
MVSESSGKIVNICSGITYSIAEIIGFIEILTNHQINVKVNELFVRKNEISHLKGSTDLLERVIKIDLDKNNIHSTLKQMLFDEK